MSIVHADLCTSKFPYNFNEMSSCVVINKGLETQRARNGTDEAADQIGIPQAYYMENVVPIARGYSSVAYTDAIPPIDGEPEVVECFELRGGGTGLALLAVTNSAQYIYDSDLLTWEQIELVDAFSPGTTSVANVKGISYIFIKGVGIFVYDFVEKDLVLQDVLGLDVGEVEGIFDAGAVLGFWTLEMRVGWSSIFNPIDFIPSLSTGAGSTSVIAIKSEIVAVLSLGEDFIIYTSLNAVAARQTGNIQYPFVFTEVVDSCGLAKRQHVAYNTNSQNHIAWTPNGFQQITVKSAEFIWPELSDGISRGILITLDELMNRPQYSNVDALEVRLQFCSNRYVAISLREASQELEGTPFKEAYLFDARLLRWGRLVCDHISFFEFTIQHIEGRYTYAELDADYLNYEALDEVGLAYSDIDANPIPAAGQVGANFGIFGVNGRVDIMAPVETADFRGGDSGIVSSLSRIFLGRYKVVRESGVILTWLQVTKLLAADIRVHGHGYDGSYVRITENFMEDLRQPGRWLQTCSADSVSIEFNSSFVITDLSMELQACGGSNQYSKPARKKFFSYVSTFSYVETLTGGYFWQDTEGNQFGFPGTEEEGFVTQVALGGTLAGEFARGDGANLDPNFFEDFPGLMFAFMYNEDRMYFVLVMDGMDGSENLKLSGNNFDSCPQMDYYIGLHGSDLYTADATLGTIIGFTSDWPAFSWDLGPYVAPGYPTNFTSESGPMYITNLD